MNAALNIIPPDPDLPIPDEDFVATILARLGSLPVKTHLSLSRTPTEYWFVTLTGSSVTCEHCHRKPDPPSGTSSGRNLAEAWQAAENEFLRKLAKEE